MRFPAALAAAATAAATGVLQARAEPECLARGESFATGQYACLKVGENGRLALCESMQGVMNWREVQDHCPGGEAEPEALPPARAASCLANAQAYGAGRLACLSVGGTRYLARCDLVLNASSWTKVEDGCPGNPPLNAGQETDDGSWKALKKPRQLIDRLLGKS